jgi:uncharacterized protein (DUF2336 family)
MLSGLFRRKAADPEETLPRVLSYEESKHLAESGDVATRRALARREDVRPEILYYLAEDAVPEVRREIAANMQAPAQANKLLAADDQEEVRADIARKIARLLPSLSEAERARISDLTLETLTLLAEDQLPRIRSILSEELKHSELAPHAVIKRLASDVEAIVAAPILEYSPLLSDHDILEIITSGVAQGAMPAIARRENLAAPVADAVVASMDVPAVAALLRNPSAQIREETLDQIVDNAASVEGWHEPLVLRPELSVRAMRRIATFVARSLVETLVREHQIDAELETALKAAVEGRIKFEATAEEPPAVDLDSLLAAGTLDEEAIAQAIARKDRLFLIGAFAHLSDLTPAQVERLLSSKSPPAITALVWKSGLSMRLAIAMQRDVAQIAPQEILNARNGVDYPLTPDNMTMQLDVFAA